MELEDLPVIVKFLLQTVSSTEAQQVRYAINPGNNDPWIMQPLATSKKDATDIAPYQQALVVTKIFSHCCN